MLNFRPSSLVFLLVFLTIERTLSFKCDFTRCNSDNSFECCYIAFNSNNNAQDFSIEKITTIDYNGTAYGSLDVTETELPVCKMFPNLKNIYISYVKSVSENFFSNCKKLERIGIMTTDITDIPEKIFHKQKNLELNYIAMIYNKFTTLSENIFHGLTEVTVIDLENNQITHLPQNIFKPLTKIEQIFLGYNKIQTLHPGLFDGMVKLHYLAVDNNELIDLPKNIFAPLINLKTLNFNYNNLTIIHSDSFGELKNLTEVTFSDNQIDAIDEKIFKNVMIKNVTIFDFSSNPCVIEAANNKEEELRKCFENYQPREE